MTARSHRLALLQTALVSAAFAMQLVVSNAINPLLPVYREQLDLSALVLSLTFVLYVGALVAVLSLLANPRFARHAPWLLLVSLVVLIASDLFAVHPEPWSILASRVLVGVAGGLGTGAASALVVGTIGAAGRAITSTGNIAGAVVGTVGAQLLVSLLGAAAPAPVFLGHAAIAAVLAVVLAVVLWVRRRPNARALEHQTGALQVGTRQRMPLPARAVPLLLAGGITWAALSISVVFSATIFAELGQTAVQALGPALLLVASGALQLASPALARVAPWLSGMLLLALGAASVAVAVVWAQPIAGVVGLVAIGAGAGIAYRAALVVFTLGARSSQQGALASVYAAVTYAEAAVAALGVGRLSDLVGFGPAAVGTFGALAVLAAAALLWAPRLRDTVEPGAAPA
ncbi:MFS transporter [Agrococcus beijingensis]|uniref:MFS transporter n=1 Tax=Agrococcus beijingensis TaxID=3068634 RepID=UPI002741836E|nr:MFS transporter [Agrococcus sp. REN33]